MNSVQALALVDNTDDTNNSVSRTSFHQPLT